MWNAYWHFLAYYNQFHFVEILIEPLEMDHPIQFERLQAKQYGLTNAYKHCQTKNQNVTKIATKI